MTPRRRLPGCRISDHAACESGRLSMMRVYCESPGQRLSSWASLLAQLFRHWTGKPVRARRPTGRSANTGGGKGVDA